MNEPAGWHRQPDGRDRYWDGEQWTDHFHDPEYLPVQAHMAPTTSEPNVQTQRFQHQSLKVMRGREARKIAEQKKLGWELHEIIQGRVRTTLNFRRPSPADPFATGWAAFRRLRPGVQLGAGLAALSLLVALPVAAVVAGGQEDRTEGPGAALPSTQTSTAAAPSPSPTVAASASPSPSPSEAYTYTGPEYEVVTIDENVSVANLSQYWVYTDKFDFSSDQFRDEVKQIITDVARREGSAKVIVQVVTDKEIIEAESIATIKSFMTEKGADYFAEVVVPKEKTDWVAWYQGGFDPDLGAPSDDPNTFEIAWIAEQIEGTEKWKPAVG